MKRLLLVSILALGCSSAPEAAPAPEAASSTPGARPLIDLSVAPDPGLVVAFKARFEALAGAPACQAALVRDEPEHAHALFVSPESDALRGAIADAFARQREPQVAYLDSLRALGERSAEQGAEARLAFVEVGDVLLSAEAALAEELANGRPCDARSLVAVQRVQAAVLHDVEHAADVALAARHATALERLDALRQLSPEAAPRDPSAWTRSLLQVALERRQPLAALRHAATLVRDGAARVPAADRLLLARAHQLAAQTESALAEALQTADDAATDRDPRTEACARALVAELMIDLDRHDAAADEFEAAERLFTQAGDPEGRLRQAVNRAGVLVRVKRLDDAEAALAPVRGLSLPGEEGADLTCRRDVTGALLDMLAGRVTGEEAARRIDQALDVARAAGAYRAVEQYASLPGRLRPGPG